jgi:hypothetical protein
MFSSLAAEFILLSARQVAAILSARQVAATLERILQETT